MRLKIMQVKTPSNIKENPICTGDENTIGYLYDNFFTRASVFADSIINDEFESKDIVQKVFTKIWSMNLRFDSLIHFKTYLYNAVKNSCLNYLRTNRSENNEVIEELESSIEESIIKTEIESELIKQVKRLPETKREIILSRLKGMTLEDIAKKLMISKNTVKTHIRLANKQLKENLKNIYLFFLISYHP